MSSQAKPLSELAGGAPAGRALGSSQNTPTTSTQPAAPLAPLVKSGTPVDPVARATTSLGNPVASSLETQAEPLAAAGFPTSPAPTRRSQSPEADQALQSVGLGISCASVPVPSDPATRGVLLSAELASSRGLGFLPRGLIPGPAAIEAPSRASLTPEGRGGSFAIAETQPSAPRSMMSAFMLPSFLASLANGGSCSV